MCMPRRLGLNNSSIKSSAFYRLVLLLLAILAIQVCFSLTIRGLPRLAHGGAKSKAGAQKRAVLVDYKNDP